ncbi:NADH dehydrogenase [Planoprotostelium fungivorum]|uniref:NADH dehydrogenase n=1 Tax=Planoprotostelium fungivorum TaxID=1890364 RepID=A0A2P6N375_9EUKA|nr:NADH dehydrogenase [Planoprotostelium fungivorum]
MSPGTTVLSWLFVLYHLALRVTFIFWRWIVFILESILRLRLLSYSSHKKRVIIIGGGHAGTIVASDLEHDFQVTLIDPKNSFEFLPSKLRTLVDPDHANKVQVRYDQFLRSTDIINDSATSADHNGVVVSGIRYDFDYLVIATGARYVDPNSIPLLAAKQIAAENEGDSVKFPSILSARAHNLHHHSHETERANSIVVIGGGIVGVELAAELAETFPRKIITLVQSGPKLMPRSPDRAIRYTENWFRHQAVRLILRDRIISRTDRGFETKGGLKIDAQLAFVATGNLPNTEFLCNTTLSRHVEENGLIRVNSFFQMEGSENVFAVGDVAAVPNEVEKLSQSAGKHAQIVAHNIRAIESKRPLRAYTAKSLPMLISLGKFDGILTYRQFTLTGLLPALMKEFVEYREMARFWAPSFQHNGKRRHVHVV